MKECPKCRNRQIMTDEHRIIKFCGNPTCEWYEQLKECEYTIELFKSMKMQKWWDSLKIKQKITVYDYYKDKDLN